MRERLDKVFKKGFVREKRRKRIPIGKCKKERSQATREVRQISKASKKSVCRLLSISRMGLYKKEKREQQEFIEASIIVNAVRKIREEQPKIGVRKLQVL